MKASLFALLPALASFVHGLSLLHRNAVATTSYTALTVRAEVASSETCGDISDLVPLFQLYAAANTVHFYSADNSIVTQAMGQGVYVFNGVAALVFPTPEVSTVPFYSLVNTATSTFFYTASAPERADALSTGGFVDYDIAGYIYPTQICGSIPLYRAQVIGANSDWLYTTSAQDRDNAIVNQEFTDEGIAGYVFEIGSGIIIS
ncbi:hypothetical protein C8R44DRAFT_974469 [Mycena epipterygia]|nr:hypothetical protein C8R44DRAFT_974469 [Mycena epipterygia]